MLHLVKPALDVGLYTNRTDAMRAFYEGEVRLAYNHLLKAGRGVHQHRLDLEGDGVLKLNDAPRSIAGRADRLRRPRRRR